MKVFNGLIEVDRTKAYVHIHVKDEEELESLSTKVFGGRTILMEPNEAIDIANQILAEAKILIDNLKKPCSDCDGSGWQEVLTDRICGKCMGTGEVPCENV